MNISHEEFFWEAYRLGNPIRACEDYKHLIECKICRGKFQSAGELYPCSGCSLEFLCQKCSHDFMASHVGFNPIDLYNTVNLRII